MPEETPAIAYHVVRELHVGGMARLSLAMTSDGQQVVLRQLLPLNVLNLRLRRQFTNGVRIRAALSPHPLIVRSLEWGRHGVVPYELIEYVDGQSLRRLLQLKDSCVTSEPLVILKQCAEAMAHCHERGFIHLDIKPENFLVSRLDDGRVQVQLTDFDLSRESTPRKERRQAGTVAYLAPEQIRRDVVGPPADVFAFGIMAYELVTGRMPFQGKHERQVRWRQTSDRYVPKPPMTLKPDITPRVDRIVSQCLEKDPAQRFPSMVFLCEELRKA